MLIGVYLFSRQFYNPTTAALATLLLSLSWPFIQASHYIRPDITLAFFVILALICYLTGYLHQKRWAFFVAGLLIGLSIDVHPNGLFFAISLGLMHIVIFRKKLFNNPATWLFTGGAALAALYYFGYRYGFNFKVALQLSPWKQKFCPRQSPDSIQL